MKRNSDGGGDVCMFVLPGAPNHSYKFVTCNAINTSKDSLWFLDETKILRLASQTSYF